jgi:eukaryotic-like serine/threonine-protein kinase
MPAKPEQARSERLSAEQWTEAQRLFHAASALPPEQRQACLHDSCTDDRILAEVETLLAWEEKSADFIEKPAIEMAAQSLAEWSSEPAPGDVVDRYRIVSRLGSGGMGVVYKAEDTRLGRTVALKFLLAEFTGDSAALERFRAEARILSALNHPNICVIYDISEDDKRIFIAMEHVSGRRLDHLIAVTPIPYARALRYATQIAAGLAKAHAAGVIHRDLKPGNIMVTDEGEIKLLDFGVAKLMRHGPEIASGDDAATLTAVGTLIGTAAYMSPEQAEARVIDARSDVFAFGAVLYEMITGRRAFEGSSSIATLASVLRSEPEPISAVLPSVPPELERIVSRCLRKDPERRFQTAADLRVALEEIREETESGRLITPFRSEPKVRSKRPLIAVLVCLVLALGAGLSWFLLWPRNLLPIPSDKRVAVLLFKNVGDDPANQPLCDGLMEDVSNSLTRLEQFRGSVVVVPASDVLKDGVSSARDAGKALGANLAITGSVERSSKGAVHVLINLVDTRSVTQLRTETIETKDPDLPNLQDEVTQKVAGMLELALDPDAKQAMKGGTTQHADAYVAYIKGLGYLRRYDKVANVDSAIQSFRRATAIDPAYVLPFAGLAEAYWRRYAAVKDDASLDLALENSSHALSLNDRLAPVHVTMGMIRAGKGQYEMAESEFQTALKLDPLNSHAWLERGKAYDAAGKHDIAQASFRKAIELRNDDWAALTILGTSFFRKGQYQEAEPYFQQVVQLTPDSAKAYSNLGGLYLKMGRLAEATFQLKKSISIEPTAAAWSNLGTSYYLAGRYSDAILPFEKATELTPANSALWGNLADAYRWTPSQAGKATATYNRALELAQKEIVVNPRDAELHARVATYWAAVKNRERASLEIEEALSLAPNDATVQFKASLVYEQANQRDRALIALQAALEDGYGRPQIDTAPLLDKLRADSRFRIMINRRSNGKGDRN